LCGANYEKISLEFLIVKLAKMLLLCTGARAKKTALLQAEAGAFVLGLANVLFLCVGRCFSQCDHRAQSAWGKKN
jgi:hypothetical protein